MAILGVGAGIVPGRCCDRGGCQTPQKGHLIGYRTKHLAPNFWPKMLEGGEVASGSRWTNLGYDLGDPTDLP